MMKKMLILLNVIIGTSIAATNASDVIPDYCKQYKAQMLENHQIIDEAYAKKDACTMGKRMITNRQIFESHLECFPHLQKIMNKGQLQALTK